MRVRTGETGDCVVVEVADDGPGVPRDMAGAGLRTVLHDKGVGQGTGLGLSVSLGIAEAHGGIARAHADRRGACFRLTIPRPSADARIELR